MPDERETLGKAQARLPLYLVEKYFDLSKLKVLPHPSSPIVLHCPVKNDLSPS